MIFFYFMVVYFHFIILMYLNSVYMERSKEFINFDKKFIHKPFTVYPLCVRHYSILEDGDEVS